MMAFEAIMSGVKGLTPSSSLMKAHSHEGRAQFRVKL